jgi:exopolysaccharide biosynthesis polyprenyl glycosylphosphotransferase
MNTFRRQALYWSIQSFDLLVLAFASVLGIVLAREAALDVRTLLGARLTIPGFAVVVALLAGCHWILRGKGIYESRRWSSLRNEAGDILKAVTLCSFLLGAAILLLGVEAVTGWRFFAVFWGTATVMLLGSRLALRRILAHLRRNGRNLRHVLIVGSNGRAVQLAAKIQRTPELGYLLLLGFADDAWPRQQALRGMGYRVAADLENVSGFLREQVVDEVFICLPLKSYYECVQHIIEHCERQGIIVRLVGRLFDVQLAHAAVETFEDEAIVSLYTGRMAGWPLAAKRVVDVAGSLGMLTLLAPVFLMVAVAIKVTSPGPVFFKQERVGISKRRFHVLKFRTMVVDAEKRQQALERLNEVSGPVFKIRNDPRITPTGHFLRKTSIDELPQLLNVLRGDMSLVGPRPLPVRDYQGFEEEWHRRRFSVRPGITCLWQVSGRSGIPFDRWMELDMEYIDRWSLWLDLKILLRTVPAVLKGSGAA